MDNPIDFGSPSRPASSQRTQTPMRQASPLCDPHYVPSDVAIAEHVFGANCGPVSLAVAISEDVCDVMRWFPEFMEPERRYTNLTAMRKALYAMGNSPKVLRQEFPAHGVALIQWLGPWTKNNFFSRWSLRHSHWIAVSGQFVFDYIDATWRTIASWEQNVVPMYLNQIPQAAGWDIKFGIEVEKSNSLWQGSFFSGLFFPDRLPMCSSRTDIFSAKMWSTP